jgi:hypothetical protein
VSEKKSTTKRGRPRVNLEFREARELIRNEQISSVVQFKRWWALNTPARIPKRPDRAYKHEWEGWNDFLGSNNPFPCVKQHFRSFKEARAFIQQLGLTTKSEYIEYAKSSRKPADIPSRPDLIYRKDWFTWADFIGADIASVKRNIETADAMFFIINNPGRPNNVYQFGITMDNVQDIVKAQQNQRFKIVGLYYCNIEFDWTGFAEEYGREYWESGRQDEYLVPNIHDFIFQISDFVEPVRKQ